MLRFLYWQISFDPARTVLTATDLAAVVAGVEYTYISLGESNADLGPLDGKFCMSRTCFGSLRG